MGSAAQARILCTGRETDKTYSETVSRGGYREATTGTAGVAFLVRFKYRRMWSRLDTNLTGTACQQYRVHLDQDESKDRFFCEFIMTAAEYHAII